MAALSTMSSPDGMLAVLLVALLWRGSTAVRCDREPDGTIGSRQTTNIPFGLRVESLPPADQPEALQRRASAYLPGQDYLVSLLAEKDWPMRHFTDFMVTVESVEGLEAGSFSPSGNTFTKFSERCRNAVVQTSSMPKLEVSAYWRAPAPGSGCVVFRASVMEFPNMWYMDDGPLSLQMCEDQAVDDAGPTIVDPCCACEEAKYEMAFEGLWSRHTHPKDFPKDHFKAKFSDVIGASHMVDYKFWNYGEFASEGLKELAEEGSTHTLESELKEKSQHIRTIIKARGIGYPNVTGKTFAVFRVDSRNHLVSVVSKISPSPDWVVGVSGLELCQTDCTWVERHKVELYPWDIGTDSGITYESDDSPSIPAERIIKITSNSPNDPMSPFYDANGEDLKPLAILYVTRQRLYEKESCQNSVGSERDINCAVTEWSSWTPCSASCGEGQRVRTRDFVDPARSHVSRCQVQLSSNTTCMAAPCRDRQRFNGGGTRCELSNWSDWSRCSATCGRGYHTRTRHYLQSWCSRQPGTSRLKETEICDGEEETCDRDGDEDGEKDGKQNVEESGEDEVSEAEGREGDRGNGDGGEEDDGIDNEEDNTEEDGEENSENDGGGYDEENREYEKNKGFEDNRGYKENNRGYEENNQIYEGDRRYGDRRYGENQDYGIGDRYGADKYVTRKDENGPQDSWYNHLGKNIDQEVTDSLQKSTTRCPRMTEWTSWSPCSVSCGRGIRMRNRYLDTTDAQTEMIARMMRGEEDPGEDAVEAGEDCDTETLQEEECKGPLLSCEPPTEEVREICLMEKDKGPCYNPAIRWYFDKETLSCQQFEYGGCRGNRNKFNSQDACEQMCGGITVVAAEESTTEGGPFGGLVAGNQITNTYNLGLAAHAYPNVKTARSYASITSLNGRVVDCVVTPWSRWSTCSASCGHGYKQRTRTIKVSPVNGGRACPRKLLRRKKCRLPTCDYDLAYHSLHRRYSEEVNYEDTYEDSQEKSSLSEEGTINGEQTLRSSNDIPKGSGEIAEKIDDKTLHKPPFIRILHSGEIDCELSEWTAWSSCSTTCGTTAYRQRTRSILTQPSEGGLPCDKRIEVKPCMLQPCRPLQ